MRGLLVGLTLLSLTLGAVTVPSPASAGFDPAREGRPGTTPGTWVECGPAAPRAEARPLPSPGAHAPIPFGHPPLPTLPTAPGATTEADAAVVALLELIHPLRGPPSFLG